MNREYPRKRESRTQESAGREYRTQHNGKQDTGGAESMKREYQNQYTGEIYFSIRHAVKTIVSDMVHYPKCRTWKMFHVKRYREGGRNRKYFDNEKK